MNFPLLLQPTYWLNISPPDVSGVRGLVFLAICGVLIAAGVACRVLAAKAKAEPPRETALLRAAKAGMTMGVIGAVLVFLSYENIRLLGGRFWYPVLTIGLVGWVVWIVVSYRRAMKLWTAKSGVTDTREKYLPRPKH